MRLFGWPLKGLHWLESQAKWLQRIGLATAVLWNLYLWRRDQSRLAQTRTIKPPELSPESVKPLVSILLPAWNESNNIDACLQAILNMRYPNIQVIVCAGGDDDTLLRASKYARHTVIVLEQQPGEGKQIALRRCYSQAGGSVIFLTDADCLLDDISFERTLAPVLVLGEAASTGSWRPFDSQTNHPLVRHQWSYHAYRELWLGEYAQSLDGRNAAISQKALDDVGAFILDAPTGTDYVLSRQLEAGGYSIRFARGSQVQTEYPQSMSAYRKQVSRWFRTPLILGWHWNHWRSVASVLWAGATSLLMLLSLPLWLVSGWKILRAVWFTAVAQQLISSFRIVHHLNQVEATGFHMRDYLHLVLYLPLNWLVMSTGLKDTLNRHKRDTW